MVKILASLVLLVLYCPSFAGGAEQSVIVLGTNHVPPFKIINGKRLEGINAEVLQEIFRGMNLQLEIRECPWQRCLSELKDGKIDAILGMFKSPQREDIYYFCEPPYKERSDKAFYLRKGEGHRVQSYEDLYSLNMIGVTRGYNNFERFDTDKQLKKEFVTNHIQNLKKLIGKRFDAFIQTEEAADYLIKTEGYTDKIEKAPYKFDAIHPSYFVISRQSPFMSRVGEFEANLHQFVQDDLYKEISRKWTH